MRAAKPTDAAQTAAAMRDRVTVDLRGIRPQLQAHAARRQMTTAALVRRAVTAMLNDAPSDVGESESIDCASSTQVVKVTLRLPVAHAVVLASRARAADVSQGSYVARLIAGTPAQPRTPDHDTDMPSPADAEVASRTARFRSARRTRTRRVGTSPRFDRFGGAAPSVSSCASTSSASRFSSM